MYYYCNTSCYTSYLLYTAVVQCAHTPGLVISLALYCCCVFCCAPASATFCPVLRSIISAAVVTRTEPSHFRVELGFQNRKGFPNVECVRWSLFGSFFEVSQTPFVTAAVCHALSCRMQKYFMMSRKSSLMCWCDAAHFSHNKPGKISAQREQPQSSASSCCFCLFFFVRQLDGGMMR